ncbi:MAG: hypothetical protein Q8940_17710 [Bacteroidota bacterium]|nr:hypothetical protein [Bacteroidota bacterium]
MLSTNVNYKGNIYTLLCAKSLASVALRCGARRFGLKDQGFVISGFFVFCAFFDNKDKALAFYGYLSAFKYDPRIMAFKFDSFEKKGQLWYRVYAPISEEPVKKYFYRSFRSLCKYYKHHTRLSCLYVV